MIFFMRKILLLVSTLSCFAFGQAGANVQLRGDRFPGLRYDQMTPEQKALTDRAAAGRGAIGTFNIMLRSPELSELIRGTSGTRTRTQLPPKQTELGIIMNARYWTTQFEWLVHRQAAEQAGLSAATTAAIRDGRVPTDLKPDEAPVYNFLRELLTTKQVSDPTFAAAKASLGEKGIVDLLAIVGFYHVTSLMMNVDRYPMANPSQVPELKPLAAPIPVAATQPQSGPARFPTLAANQMTPEQSALAAKLQAGAIQGSTRGPYNALLRSPELGEGILRLGEYVRFRSPAPAKLNELATLVTTRYWSSQFPFYAHHQAATQAGLAEPVIAAIAQGRRPQGLQPDEQAVYNFTAELLKTSAVSDATFAAAKRTLGERGMVELMGIMGYYGLVSTIVNTDRYPLPDDVAPELPALARPLP